MCQTGCCFNVDSSTKQQLLNVSGMRGSFLCFQCLVTASRFLHSSDKLLPSPCYVPASAYSAQDAGKMDLISPCHLSMPVEEKHNEETMCLLWLFVLRGFSFLHL